MWPHFIKSLSEEEMAQVNSNVGAARRVLLCSDYLSSGETENLKYSWQDKSWVETRFRGWWWNRLWAWKTQQTESSSDNPDSQDVQSYPEPVNVSDIFQFDDTFFVCPVRVKVYKTCAERRRCSQERSEERVSQEALISAQQSELDIQNGQRERSLPTRPQFLGCFVKGGYQRISCLNHASKWCYQMHIAVKFCV